MDGGTVLLLLLVAVASVGGLGYLSHRKQKQRRLAIEAWAARTGLSFRADRDRGVERRFPPFSCLRTGDDRYAYNLAEGNKDGRGVCAFDYHYETHTTNSKGQRQTHTHRFSAVVVTTDLPLRDLSVRPEGFFDRITEALGFDDIDFESSEFSRAFFVKASDRRWAFEVLHQATMEFLLAAPRFTIEMAGPWVLVRRGSCFRPEEFDPAIGVAVGILDRLPRYLVKELKGGDA